MRQVSEVQPSLFKLQPGLIEVGLHVGATGVAEGVGSCAR